MGEARVPSAGLCELPKILNCPGKALNSPAKIPVFPCHTPILLICTSLTLKYSKKTKSMNVHLKYLFLVFPKEKTPGRRNDILDPQGG